MNVDYPLLIGALLLLWFPRQLLRLRERKPASRSVRRGPIASEQIVRDDTLKLRQEFGKSRNWVDFARAATGGLVVLLSALQPEEDGKGSLQVRLLQIAVLLIAVLIQMIRMRHGRVSLAAPVFFLMGLCFVLIGWQSAIFACVSTWAFARVLPGPGWFLLVLAVLQAVFGLLFKTAPVTLIACSVFLTMLPLLSSGMFKRPLVPVKKRQRNASV